MGCVAKGLQREPARFGAVTITPRPRADLEIEQTYRPDARRPFHGERRIHALGFGECAEVAIIEHRNVGVGMAHPCTHRAEPREDLPFVRAIAGIKDRIGEPCRAAHLPHRDQVVEVGLLQRGETGQQHVRVAGGLVQRVVEADHAFEFFQSGVQAGRAGRADHGVTGDGDERADLTGSRSVDLLGHARHRHLSEHLRDAAYA